jgi:RNA polymerase sigma-70 factor (ECF subfamily)
MMQKTQSIEEAFTAMVKRNEALIYKVCLAFTRQQRDEVQDLKQEVLCNLWRGFSTFKNESRETTWIYKVALNTGIQYYHRNERLPLTEELTSQMAERYVGEDDSRQLDRMYELIHRLDDEEQKLVYLYIDNVSGKEMAEVLGISEGNVRIKMFRVKEKLKRMAQYEKD